MSFMGMAGTKWQLFVNSVDLFARRGYHDVSVRDIAEATGIKAASIYNHFASKEHILATIYEFYDYQYNHSCPPLEDVIGYVGKEPVQFTLFRAFFEWDDSIKALMQQIFVIASTQICSDEMAQHVIYKNIFKKTEQYLSALLKKMIETELIEPLDTDAFILLFSSLCHSASLRMQTNFPIERDMWERGAMLLFAAIKEKNTEPHI